MPRQKKTNPAECATLAVFTAPTAAPAEHEARAPASSASKLATLITLLQAPEGATLESLCEATGWQSHSVRGALAGSLKRKGHVVTSTKPDHGPRRYRIKASA